MVFTRQNWSSKEIHSQINFMLTQLAKVKSLDKPETSATRPHNGVNYE